MHWTIGASHWSWRSGLYREYHPSICWRDARRQRPLLALCRAEPPDSYVGSGWSELVFSWSLCKLSSVSGQKVRLTLILVHGRLVMGLCLLITQHALVGRAHVRAMRMVLRSSNSWPASSRWGNVLRSSSSCTHEQRTHKISHPKITLKFHHLNYS